MGLRKLKEYPKPLQMRVLKSEPDESSKFPDWMLIILMIALAAGYVFKATQNDKEETLEEFVERVKETKNKVREKYILGNTTDKQIGDFKKIANIDIRNYLWTIDNYFIRHTKRHKEISLKDYMRLYRTINNYDSLKYATKQKQGIVKIELYKTYERINILILEIRRSEIYITTMFKRKFKQTSAHK